VHPEGHDNYMNRVEALITHIVTKVRRSPQSLGVGVCVLLMYSPVRIFKQPSEEAEELQRFRECVQTELAVKLHPSDSLEIQAGTRARCVLRRSSASHTSHRTHRNPGDDQGVCQARGEGPRGDEGQDGAFDPHRLGRRVGQGPRGTCTPLACGVTRVCDSLVDACAFPRASISPC
jgi:hypothetical protein